MRKCFIFMVFVVKLVSVTNEQFVDYSYINRFYFTLNERYLQEVSEDLNRFNFRYNDKVVSGLYVFEQDNAGIGNKYDDSKLQDILTAFNGKIESVEQCRDMLTSQLPGKAASVSFDDVPEHWHHQDSDTHLLVCSPYYDEGEGIDAVWELGYTGKGVTVAVTDIGVDIHHPELRQNIDENMSKNFVNPGRPPVPETDHNYQDLYPITNHGNACSSLIAGVKGNNLCSAGVAHNAKLVAYKVVGFRYQRISFYGDELAKALVEHCEDIDVYSNSWDFKSTFTPLDTGMRAAILEGVKKGRKGKGSIYVFPAGLPGNGFTNNIYTVSVTSIGFNGTLPPYEQANSATLISAFGQGNSRFTDDMVTASHSVHGTCTNTFEGSSAATAIISGVVALILEANPELSWRDVQHILVESSEYEGLVETPNFHKNGAGKHFHRVLGFGHINASKGIELALQWVGVREHANHTAQLSRISPINKGSKHSQNIFETDVKCRHRLEYVAVDIPVMFLQVQNTVYLQSPSGTKSLLLNNIPQPDSHKQGHVHIVSANFWGEATEERWILVSDAIPHEEYILINITFYGTPTEDNLPASEETHNVDDNTGHSTSSMTNTNENESVLNFLFTTADLMKDLYIILGMPTIIVCTFIAFVAMVITNQETALVNIRTSIKMCLFMLLLCVLCFIECVLLVMLFYLLFGNIH